MRRISGAIRFPRIHDSINSRLHTSESNRTTRNEAASKGSARKGRKVKMENTADSSDKKIYEKPVIAKCGDFRKLTGGVFTTESDLLVGRRGMI